MPSVWLSNCRIVMRDFRRIIFPFGDRVRHRIVEPEQALLHSRERGNSPETFSPAKDRPSSVCRPIICVMLENCAPILHYQHRTATPALGVFCSVRAIRCFDLPKCGLRYENKRESQTDWVARASRPEAAGASASSRSQTFLWCGTNHMVLL